MNARWIINPETQMKRFGHPTMFPEELARRVIQLFSYKGDVVLDPMCGSGTTCKMAYHNQRKYIGIDISEEYLKIADERLRQLNLFAVA